jgi:hypothetical protein
MAYKYFTEELLTSDINLADVFAEKQEDVRERQNVSYGLYDIAIYLQDITQGFKTIENQYVELDNALSEIINKWYKSKGENNPFISDFDEELAKEFDSKNPRQAAVVEDGKITGKMTPKSAPDVRVSKAEVKSVTPVTSVSTSVSDKVQKFKDELAKRQEIFDDVYDDEEKADFIVLMRKKMEADEFIAEDGDEYFIERVKILKDFIQKNSK